MAEELLAAEKAFIPAWCAKPKAAPAAAWRPLEPISDFATSLRVSKILPPADLAQLAYPRDKRALDLKPRLFRDNLCDRHQELAKAGAALVYYAARVRCKARMRLAMLLGYDGPVKAWIDGKELFFDPGGANPANIDKAKVPFTAARGEHEILVALDSHGGQAWGIYLRFERLALSRRDLANGIRPEMLPEVVREKADRGLEEVSSMAARGTKPGKRK